jgi:hypothetical protein
MVVVMSAAEREEFLAGVHVGVLSAVAGTAGQTLARRYLGAAGGDRYIADNPDRTGERGVPDAPRALAQPGPGQRTSRKVGRIR